MHYRAPFLTSMMLLNSNNMYKRPNTFVATKHYIVQPGDSMWKIAQMFQVGLSELIAANPQIQDPALIYPNQRLVIPLIDETTLAFEQEVVRLTNNERSSRGVSPLTLNWEVARVARIKSEDMDKNKYFSHTSPTYGSPFDMLKDFGIKFSAAAENIAKGQRTAAAVVNAWMNSQGHRENILNANFTEMGAGYSNMSGTPYWTQMFIRP